MRPKERMKIEGLKEETKDQIKTRIKEKMQ
jgi:hypothetical protein